jgi:hypothetical protein
VDEFMPDHVPELRHGAVGGDDDAPFEELEESPDPFGNESAGGVGLLKVEVRTVEDQRDPVCERVVELPLKVAVGLFGECGPALREVFHLRIIVNVEPGSLEDVPFEVRVLDFVASKVEKLCPGGGRAEKQEQQDHTAPSHTHGTPDQRLLERFDAFFIVGSSRATCNYQEVPFRSTVTTKIRASVTTATTTAIFCCRVMLWRAPVSGDR